jgi:hypothetical protein
MLIPIIVKSEYNQLMHQNKLCIHFSADMILVKKMLRCFVFGLTKLHIFVELDYVHYCEPPHDSITSLSFFQFLNPSVTNKSPPA